MGRRATTEIDATVEAAPPPDESGGDDAASLFDATGDARVRILRRDTSTQKWVTHGFFPPNVKEEDVSSAFGGGDYRAQLVIPDPASGLSKIKRSRDFKVPGVYRPPNKISGFDDAGQNGNAATPAAAIAATSSGIPQTGELMQALNAGVISSVIDLLKSMREVKSSDASTLPMMVKMMEAQAASQQNVMQLMMTILTTVMTKNDNGSDSKKDILDMMARMKELVAPAPNAPLPTDPMQMFNNMLDTFKSFREAAEDVAPKGDSADPILGSIPKLVEVVAEQHQMNKAAAAAGVVTRVPTPTPHGGMAQMPHVGVIPPEIPMWRRILQQQGARLLAAAVAKADPDVVAGASILFAPPAVREALLAFFHREENEVIADVFTEIPSMGDHREWLAEFVNCAQQRLFPDEFVDDEPEAEDASATEESK